MQSPDQMIKGVEKDQEHPDEYCCSISQELMEDPVSIIDNGVLYSFDRANITAWFVTHNTNPLTNKVVSTVLISNLGLKSIIQNYKLNLARPTAPTTPDVSNGPAVVMQTPHPSVEPATVNNNNNINAPAAMEAFSEFEFYSFLKDAKHAELALKDAQASRRFTSKQLCALATEHKSLARMIFLSDFVLRVTHEDKFFALVALHRKKHLTLSEFLGLANTDTCLALIATEGFKTDSDEEHAALAMPLLMNAQLWPLFSDRQWQWLFSSQTVATQLLSGTQEHQTLLSRVPQDAARIFYTCLLMRYQSYGLGFLRSFLSNAALCGRLADTDFYVSFKNYYHPYLVLVSSHDHIVSRFSAGTLQSFMLALMHEASSDFLATQEAVSRLHERVPVAERSPQYICGYYRFFNKKLIEHAGEATMLTQLDTKSRFDLAMVNRSCFLLFYAEENFIESLDRAQLQQINQHYAPIFIKDDSTRFQNRICQRRDDIIRAELHSVSGFKRQVAIADYVSKGDEATALLLVRENFWREAGNPNVTLLSLCSKHQTVQRWVAKNIDISKVDGLEATAKERHLHELYHAMLKEHRLQQSIGALAASAQRASNNIVNNNNSDANVHPKTKTL